MTPSASLPEFVSEPSEMGQQLRDLADQVTGETLRMVTSVRFDGAVINDMPAATGWAWEQVLNEPVMMDEKELAVTTTATEGHQWYPGMQLVFVEHENFGRRIQQVEQKNRKVLTQEAMEQMWVVSSVRKHPRNGQFGQPTLGLRLEKTDPDTIGWDDREYTWFEMVRETALIKNERYRVEIQQTVEQLSYWQVGNKVEIRIEHVGGQFGSLRCGVRRWNEQDKDPRGHKGVIDDCKTTIRGEHNDALIEMAIVYNVRGTAAGPQREVDVRPRGWQGFLGLASPPPQPAAIPPQFEPGVAPPSLGPISQQITGDIARAWENLEAQTGIGVDRDEDGQITGITMPDGESLSDQQRQDPSSAAAAALGVDIVVDPAMPPDQAILMNANAMNAQLGVPQGFVQQEQERRTAAEIQALQQPVGAPLTDEARRRREFKFELRRIRFQCTVKVPSETFQPFDPSVTPAKTGRLLAVSGQLKRFQTRVKQPYRWTLEQLSKRNLEAAWDAIRSTGTSPTAVIGTIFASIISSGRRRQGA